MRFEIRYPTGSPHTIELQGSLVVLGRDPGCDLVISDPKCSRRHAVIEAVGQGLTIRDTGSANGIYVNGKRVERSSLEPDDFVRIGEVILKVLPDEITGTIVMGPDELEAPTPAAVPEAKASPPATREERAPPRPAASAAPRSGPRAVPPPTRRPVAPAPPDALRTAGARAAPTRPLTVTVLAVLWLVCLPLFVGIGITTAARAGGAPVPLVLAVLAILVGVIGGVMGFGLLGLKPWARMLQIGLSVLGVVVCPFTMASALVLFYMLREDARLYFSGRPVPGRGESARATELTFTLSLVAMVALGVLLTGLSAWLSGGRIPRP
jgi:Inner membrane component of T3SS, cytoplasmic domain